MTGKGVIYLNQFSYRFFLPFSGVYNQLFQSKYAVGGTPHSDVFGDINSGTQYGITAE